MRIQNADLVTFSLNTWKHVGVSAGTNGFYLYMNGAQLAAGEFAFLPAKRYLGMTGNPGIGNFSYGGDVRMGESRLWKKQISDAEWLQNFNALSRQSVFMSRS